MAWGKVDEMFSQSMAEENRKKYQEEQINFLKGIKLNTEELTKFIKNLNFFLQGVVDIRFRKLLAEPQLEADAFYLSDSELIFLDYGEFGGELRVSLKDFSIKWAGPSTDNSYVSFRNLPKNFNFIHHLNKIGLPKSKFSVFEFKNGKITVYKNGIHSSIDYQISCRTGRVIGLD